MAWNISLKIYLLYFNLVFFLGSCGVLMGEHTESFIKASKNEKMLLGQMEAFSVGGLIIVGLLHVSEPEYKRAAVKMT